ncbi:AMP-dependent synthetase and ligase [Gonapodya prolifera JEL478]|uniref:AMP-dependent synthetase and ligase n=1 Tax=Gonapodya prolifera (strain JEL478) TaxID=1344416 RepID=A0A139ABQ6_GONPJ|nr:AMP-dependent synthetase and ligase [Gonapodya prolifera JEL478]|eukprot:KXS14109.1 AMP-dependent synthetase and ligase [Gonapodya prolifera JEL478]
MALPPPPNPPMSREQATAFVTAPGQAGEMETKVIRGNAMRVWKYGPKTMRDAFIHATTEYAPRDYLVYYNLSIGEEFRITYAQAGKIVAALANAMKTDFGVGKGSHVAIAMRNYPEYLLVYWAVMVLGGVAININAFLKPEEMEYCVLDGDSTLLFVDGERARAFGPIVSRLKKGGVKHIIECRPEGAYQSFSAKYEEILKKYLALNKPLPQVAVDPEDDAVVFYTSGTTGKPKGALSTNRAAIGGIVPGRVNTQISLLRMGYTPAFFPSGTKADPQQTALVPTPLFHVTANTATGVPFTYGGMKVILIHKWDATHALKIIEKEKVNIMAAVPSMHINILEHPDVDKYDLSSLMGLMSGGAPAPATFPGAMAKKFPMKVPTNGWGMSETLIGVIGIASEDYRLKPTSIGFPSPVIDVSFRDPEDPTKVVPTGQVGELCIRGPQVLKEYYKKAEATAKTITRDGWLRTGDLGRIDEEGFCYLVDRAKDMLIRGGENIYCVEVENCLYSHDAVMECAVIGLPHRVLGEEVGAVVQLKPSHVGKVTEKQLIDHCAAKIAKFKVPIFIQLRTEELPRNPTGKILKTTLRKDLIEAAIKKGVTKPVDAKL